MKIISNHTEVQKQCFPGTRVFDVAAQIPAVLNQGKKNVTVILHAGMNNIRLRQSEI